MKAVEALKLEGYTIRDACAALGFSRSAYYAANSSKKRSSTGVSKMKDTELLVRIKEIKAEHPFWGYRRVWAWLNHREGLLVNQKRVRRIMKEQRLMVNQERKPIAD